MPTAVFAEELMVSAVVSSVTFKIFGCKWEETEHLGDLDLNGSIILEMGVSKVVGSCVSG
jgi:hypothetical protein